MTPGQAAYEAHPVSAAVDEPWEVLDPDDRAGWEAAAQAAIDLASPPVIVHVDTKLTEEGVAELRKRIGEAVKTRKPETP